MAVEGVGGCCLGGCLLGGDVCSGEVSARGLPTGGVCLGKGVCPRGFLPRGCLPGECTLPWTQRQTPLSWTEFLTHASENITFPQLLLRTVKITSNKHHQCPDMDKVSTQCTCVHLWSDKNVFLFSLVSVSSHPL